MANTLVQKLRIKEGMKLRAINAPAGFASVLEPLPAGVKVTTGKDYQQVHWFVRNQAEMEGEMERVIGMLTGEMIGWIYYPKGSSRIQTDLTRDKGWDKLLAHQALQWISLVSFDDTWSAFGMRLHAETGNVKEVKLRPPSPVLDYIDTATRTIRLPDDVQQALDQQPVAAAYYNTLSFTNKKEYVEWIVSAKRAETRQQRTEGTIEKLLMKWKNPRNL